MRTLIVLLAIALLALPAVAQQTTYDVSATKPGYGDIYITQATYDPFPASPGTYIDVWYRVENRGDTRLDNVELILKPDGPFSLDSDSAIKNVGTLPPMQSALVKYRVRVAEDALQGDHFLKLTWRATDNEDMPIFSNQISVRSSAPLLVVSDVKVSPDKILPGDKSTIDLQLTNAGDSFLRYVTASLQLVMATSTGVTELPFTPAGKGVSESVVNLAPGKTATLSFDILAAPDATSKSYKLPVTITYVDNTGRNNSRTEIVGITVAAEPDLLVYVDKSDIVDTTPADVVLRFVNRGRADIKFLTATLQPRDAYTILNAPTQYVGAVASDDYETTSWTLKLAQAVSDVELPVVVTYEDVNGKKYSASLSVPLPVRSAQDLGQQKTSYTVPIIIIVVIVVVAFLLWRRRQGRRKRA